MCWYYCFPNVTLFFKLRLGLPNFDFLKPLNNKIDCIESANFISFVIQCYFIDKIESDEMGMIYGMRQGNKKYAAIRMVNSDWGTLAKVHLQM
jgi:hypothetical protein